MNTMMMMMMMTMTCLTRKALTATTHRASTGWWCTESKDPGPGTHRNEENEIDNNESERIIIPLESTNKHHLQQQWLLINLILILILGLISQTIRGCRIVIKSLSLFPLSHTHTPLSRLSHLITSSHLSHILFPRPLSAAAGFSLSLSLSLSPQYHHPQIGLEHEVLQ